MVLYQGAKKWNSPLSLHQLLNVPETLVPYVPQFEYALVDLSHLSDQEIKGKVFLRLFMFVLKNIDDPGIFEILETKLKPLIIELLESKSGLDYIQAMLYYLFKSADNLDKRRH